MLSIEHAGDDDNIFWHKLSPLSLSLYASRVTFRGAMCNYFFEDLPNGCFSRIVRVGAIPTPRTSSDLFASANLPRVEKIYVDKLVAVCCNHNKSWRTFTANSVLFYSVCFATAKTFSPNQF